MNRFGHYMFILFMENGKATTPMKNIFNGMHSMTETGAISYCVGLKSFTLFNVFVIPFFFEN